MPNNTGQQLQPTGQNQNQAQPNGSQSQMNQVQFQHGQNNLHHHQFLQAGGMQAQQYHQMQNNYAMSNQMIQPVEGQPNWPQQNQSHSWNGGSVARQSSSGGQNQFSGMSNCQPPNQNQSPGGGTQCQHTIVTGMDINSSQPGLIPTNFTFPSMPQTSAVGGGVQDSINHNANASVNQQQIQAQTALFWNAFRASQGQIGDQGGPNLTCSTTVGTSATPSSINQIMNSSCSSGMGTGSVQQSQISQDHLQAQAATGWSQCGNNMILNHNQMNQLQTHANSNQMIQSSQREDCFVRPSCSLLSLANSTRNKFDVNHTIPPTGNCSSFNTFVPCNTQSNGEGNHLNQATSTKHGLGAGGANIDISPAAQQQQQQLLQQMFQNHQLKGNNTAVNVHSSGMANISEYINQFQAMQQMNNFSNPTGGKVGSPSHVRGVSNFLTSQSSGQSTPVQMQQFQEMVSQSTVNSQERSIRTYSTEPFSLQRPSKSEASLSQIPTPDALVPGATVSPTSFPVITVPGGMIQPDGKIKGEVVNVEVQGIRVQGGSGESGQTRSLEGNFAGGWQSNADIADRKRIIFSIIKVIERMRPANRLSQDRLPLMAKKLEEHLYRSAQTKEEYTDLASLKRRLHLIAKGVGVPKCSYQSELRPSASAVNNNVVESTMNQNVLRPPNAIDLNNGMQPNNALQINNGMQANNVVQLNNGVQTDNAMQSQNTSMESFATGKQEAGRLNPPQMNSQLSQLHAHQLREQFLSDQLSKESVPDNSHSIGTDTSAVDLRAEKKKLVLQQQQRRLLLLRHSKLCRIGPNCDTKFCPQMVILWKHLKYCRGKTCPVPHCVSSRCVLSHHRNCKRRGLSASCEICYPVAKYIRRLTGDSDGDHWNDDWDNFSVFEADGDGETDFPPSTADNITSNSSGPIHSDIEASGLLPQLQIHHNETASAHGIQSILKDIQQKQTVLAQIRRQKGTLFSQNKMLLEQLSASHDHENSTQLQNQINLLRHLNAQFERQELFLDREISRQSQELQQMRHTQTVESQSLAAHPLPQGLAAPVLRQSLAAPPRPQSSVASQSPSYSVEEETAKSPKMKPETIKPPTPYESSNDSSPPLMYVSAPSSTVLPSHSASCASKKRSTSQKDSRMEDQDSRFRKSFKQDDSSLSSALNQDGNDASFPATQHEDLGVSKEPPADEISRGMNDILSSMPVAAIEQHLDSLISCCQLTPRFIARKCLPIVKKLIRHEHGWVFKDPVDPIELGLDDYFEIVEHPMDLGLVEKKLENCVYKEIESFERDTRLVFENAILFNGNENEIGLWARELLEIFNDEVKSLQKGLGISSKTEALGACEKHSTCSLCGKFRLLFDPPALYCSGVCGMQKIRRNGVYYTDQDKQNHWCDRCYSGLKEHQTIQLDDGKEVKKSLLVRMKNDLTPEEQWVQCDVCHEWCHQICALFNGNRNHSSSTFSCPKCVVAKSNKERNEQIDSSSFKDASALPECKLSRALELGLFETLSEEYAKIAKQRRCDLSQVEKADGLCVRVVLSLEKKHKVREEMLLRYSNKGFPSEFPVTSKCILLFQKIHGADVLLFGMYVYEYGDKCPAPNRRRVYISYLDSVHYLQPSLYRTLTYQTLIVEYLRFVRARGFHTAHIWSCPPSKGDEYIFYCHPPQQLIPKDDMLCAWYVETLKKAQEKGIVLETRTLYDEYFKNHGINPETGEPFDPTSIPYFEGDYIPGEIEKIITILNKDETMRVGAKCQDSQSKSNPSKGQKIEGKRRGTRSNPGDLVNQDRDKVMNRLDLALSRMKQNFFVAQLLSDDFIKAVEIGVDVSKWVEEIEPDPTTKLSKQIGKNPGLLDLRTVDATPNIPPSLPAPALKVIGTTVDEDPSMEQECLDTRIAFLNFCQKNYFQFDELRRAKYSTMMLLIELHDPRAEREQQFKVHLQVIAHAASCPGCVSKNCTRMKSLFDHVRKCDITYRSGCKVCVRLFMLLTKHARDCITEGSCCIPFCERIRERQRRLLRQQQLLDDRRRDEQNNRHQEESEV